MEQEEVVRSGKVKSAIWRFELIEDRIMLKKIAIILEMIKFEHTVFALPFAFTGALLAARGLPSWQTILWITIAMFGARSAAMGFNRWADRYIDAKNPRTKSRALPMGLVTPRQVIAFTLASSALLIIAASMLNPLSLYLSPLALVLLFFYSFTKRFTFFSHVFLGLAISGAPLGAWIAVIGKLEVPAIVLGIAVLLWLVGFDIMYALQDIEFDRGEGLHSIPQRFGIRHSLWIARAAHAVTMTALFWLASLLSLGWIYVLGVFISLCLIVYEHTLVREDDLSKLNFAFFNMNGYISLTVFFFTLLDKVFR